MTGLARSTNYYKPKADPTVKARQDADLPDRIKRIQAEFPGYGYRRIYWELARQGMIVNAKRLRRVMKQYGLKPITWQRAPHTTDFHHRFRRPSGCGIMSGMTRTERLGAVSLISVR